VGYKDDCKTNPNNLPNEWLDMADIWFKHGEDHVNAIRKHQKLVDSLAFLISKYDKEIRLDPSQFGATKLNETVVQRIIDSRKPVALKKEEVADAKREVDLYAKVVIPALKLKVDTLKEFSRKEDAETWAHRLSHKNSGVVDEVKGRAKARKKATPQKDNFDDVEFGD